MVDGWEFESLKKILSLTGEHHKQRSAVRIRPSLQCLCIMCYVNSNLCSAYIVKLTIKNRNDI